MSDTIGLGKTYNVLFLCTGNSAARSWAKPS